MVKSNNTENLHLFIFCIYLDAHDCPVPCQQTRYKATLDYFHQNVAALMGMEDTSSDGGQIFHLMYYYLTLRIEQKIESLEYDFGSFLAAAGGNLGLFLGMSCLSVLFSLAKCLQVIARKLQNN